MKAPGKTIRIGHYEEFLKKLPSIDSLERLMDGLQGDLSPDNMKTLEDALVAFNVYRNMVTDKSRLHAEFHPIIAGLIGGMIAAISLANRSREGGGHHEEGGPRKTHRTRKSHQTTQGRQSTRLSQ